MSKNTSVTSLNSPAKPKRSASEESKIKKLYNEQEINYKMGYELYGISEKINPIEPIPGAMKNYELDFEISEVHNGKTCVLGDTIFRNRVPPLSNMTEISKLDIVKKGLIRAEVFRSMLRTIETFRRQSDCFNIFIDELSEAQVNELHRGLQILTDLEKNLFVFETTAANGKRILRVMAHKGRMTNDDMKKWGWDKEYLHFTMKKRNIPFKKPLGVLTDVLRIKINDVGFAQLKESGPISLQRISVPKPNADKLSELIRVSNKFMIGNFEVKKESIKIGELESNRYRIVLRGLTDKRDDHEQCLEFLKSNGFINYYGNKRFLNKKGVPAYHIGKALLTRNFEEAINLIMTPSRDDPSDVRAMKERWALSDGSPIKTLEGSEAVKAEFEYKLVHQLEQNPDDLIAALEKVPLNIRLGYIFAYQSYMWNIIASQRVKRKGLKLFPGDIVLVNRDKPIPPEFYEDFSIPLTARSETLPQMTRDPKKKPNYKDAIKFVTQEDIDQQKYTIHDLVLPLPGSEVSFPRNNDVGIWYTDFLSKDGLNKTRLSDKYCINGNEIVQNVNYFLHGTYRKLIVIPKGLKWEYKTYKKLNEGVIEKDERGKSDNVPGPDKLALLLEFTLPADSYVNMALREIVDLEKSGFNDLYEANKKAIEEERIEVDRLIKERRREREVKEKERLERERRERENAERERVEREKKNAAKEKVDAGVRKERLDGRLSRDRNTREVSRSSSTRRGHSREILDGGRQSRSIGDRQSPRREVSRSSNSRIEVRVDNNRHRSRSRSNERHFNNSRFPDRFERPEDRQASFDGIPICEFNTIPEDPDIDDSFNNLSRNISMREDSRSGLRVWDSPQPRDIPPARFDARQENIQPFDHLSGARQSVFDGRLEPRPILRNPDPPETIEPGRLLQPSPFFRKTDDLRNRLNPGMLQETSYDPEREFDRFEMEVQELNRDCRRDQEILLREAMEREQRMPYGRDNMEMGRQDDRRRPLEGPLSPQIAEKLRRLDEEALRLDLKRVTRLQNFDTKDRTREEMDFDRQRRDFGDDRNMALSREQVLNRSREMEEFERNFLKDRERESALQQQQQQRGRDMMEPRYDERRRFIDEIPFGRDRSEPIRSPSPQQRRQSMNPQRPDDSFNDRFNQKSMDQRSNDFMGTGNNSGMGSNNFNTRDSSSFSDLRNNLSRNNEPVSQFGQGLMQSNSMPLQNMNQRFGNTSNFGNQGPQSSNQYRGDSQQMMMSPQQNRGMDISWNNSNNNMQNNRPNSPPKQNFPQQQWMNQDNPNFGSNQGPNSYPNNQMFGNNGSFQGPGMQQFPSNNNSMMNMNNMYPNQMMGSQNQGMMGYGMNNNNGQRGGNMMSNNPNMGPNMQGMMDDRRQGLTIGPPGYNMQQNRPNNNNNSNNRRKSRFN